MARSKTTTKHWGVKDWRRVALTRRRARAYRGHPSSGAGMRRVAAIAVLCFIVAAPAAAQTAQGEPPRRFQPPPDHWMTIDSLSQTIGLTPEQRTKVTPAYTALNGVMKDAAARRRRA